HRRLDSFPTRRSSDLTQGQLIGINFAIASPTGSYAGYSYAIPSNIVKKVVNDLMKYGSYQRAYLRVEYNDPQRLSPEKIRELGIDKNDGIYVAGVPKNGGAYEAGIRPGDFITHINGVPVHTETQLQEQIARYQPGDNISVTYMRDGKKYNTTAELKNAQGTTSIIKNNPVSDVLLGIKMRPLSSAEKSRLQVKSGVIVTDINTQGLVASQTNMKKGFIILSVNNYRVNTQDDVRQAMTGSNRIQIAGFYPGNRG